MFMLIQYFPEYTRRGENQCGFICESKEPPSGHFIPLRLLDWRNLHQCRFMRLYYDPYLTPTINKNAGECVSEGCNLFLIIPIISTCSFRNSVSCIVYRRPVQSNVMSRVVNKLKQNNGSVFVVSGVIVCLLLLYVVPVNVLAVRLSF